MKRESAVEATRDVRKIRERVIREVGENKSSVLKT